MRQQRGTLAYFKELFDLAPAAYIATDAYLAIEDANTAAVKLLRRQLDQLKESRLQCSWHRASERFFTEWSRSR